MRTTRGDGGAALGNEKVAAVKRAEECRSRKTNIGWQLVVKRCSRCCHLRSCLLRL